MFSKVLAGVFAVAVLTVGGYAYWQYTEGTPCCGTQPVTAATASEKPSCCQEVSRSSCCASEIVVSCCGDAEAGPSEVLAIQPREVK